MRTVVVRGRTFRVRPGLLAGVAFALAFPWLPLVSYSVLGSANVGAYYAVVAISLVVLTGWVGQISLGHAGLVGVGAYVAGWVTASWRVTFPVNLLWAALAGALVAAALGIVAVRVRGLYLAVATLIFSWMAVEFLFRQPWFVRHGEIDVRAFGTPGTYPYFDFASRRTYFYAAWATVAAVAMLMANLRDSKTGRAFFAVRGSEVAAASLGISVVRTKITAFALSGALAGAAGALVLVRGQVVSPDAFKVEVSLFFLAIAVVGGLSSLGGAVAAALLFASLDELFFRVAALSGWLEVVPPLLLTVVLLLYRGGLAAAPAALRARLGPRLSPYVAPQVERLRELLPSLGRPAPEPLAEPVAVDEEADLPPAIAAPPVQLPADREERAILLAAEHVTVRFGGLVAVDDVSLTVRKHEIVGLIGPNGAGKTTTFNAIAGLNVPTSGTIRVFDQDVTRWTVDERARLGVGRTFQAIQLAPQLTVFDNLLVATHLQNDSSLLSHLFAGTSSLRGERAARAQVSRVATLLELDDFLDRRVADLPFGVLRMVELARALVTGSRLLMLDEPASGLDNTETDRLAAILRSLRDLGITILLIEHDVAMVTGVSDYMYVLDHGGLLAEGTPAEIRSHPGVIAAYLGVAPESEVELVGAAT